MWQHPQSHLKWKPLSWLEATPALFINIWGSKSSPCMSFHFLKVIDNHCTPSAGTNLWNITQEIVKVFFMLLLYEPEPVPFPKACLSVCRSLYRQRGFTCLCIPVNYAHSQVRNSLVVVVCVLLNLFRFGSCKTGKTYKPVLWMYSIHVCSFSSHNQHFRTKACDTITEHIRGWKQLSVILSNHLWWQLYIIQIGWKMIIILIYAHSNVFQDR